MPSATSPKPSASSPKHATANRGRRRIGRAGVTSSCVSLLEHAARHVPFYAATGSAALAARTHAISRTGRILEKRDLAREPARVPRGRARSARAQSGSTRAARPAQPLTLWRSRRTNVLWYALFEGGARLVRASHVAVAGTNIGGRSWSRHTVRRPPYWVWSEGLRLLYMSSYHLAPARRARLPRALREHRIEYLLGYSFVAPVARARRAGERARRRSGKRSA
jgi:hypothetical protein